MVEEGEGQDGEMVSAQTVAFAVQGGQWGPQQQLPTWKRWQPHLVKARAVAALAVSDSILHGIPTPAKCKIGCKLNVMGLE